MRIAFVLLLVALMILPALVTMRIMLVRARRQLRDERERTGAD